MANNLSRQLNLGALIPDGALRTFVPDGPAGTRETLKQMRKLARMGKDTTEIRHVAAMAINQLPPKAWRWEMATMLNLVRNAVRYTLDANQIEVVQSPNVTLRLGYGDCDDMATLLAALLEAVGHECAFVAVGFGPVGEYSHVMVIARVPGETPWVPLDPTENQPIGWYPPGVTCEMIAPIEQPMG